MAGPWDIAQAHQGLIKKYLDKNRWIIEKSHSLSWEDYWQIGIIILFEAAERYTVNRGKFSSYAWKRLKWRMPRIFKAQAFPVMKVPEKRYPSKNLEVSEMSFQESFTYNVINCRVDLSAIDYLSPIENDDDSDSESGMFVFFK